MGTSIVIDPNGIEWYYTEGRCLSCRKDYPHRKKCGICGAWLFSVKPKWKTSGIRALPKTVKRVKPGNPGKNTGANCKR